ncbi:MAG: TlpA family protein disulfide reductase [Actinobacteria bacterium]|nr:TlpA family protein disulfide reductase [Actinomycetota bacterium]
MKRRRIALFAAGAVLVAFLAFTVVLALGLDGESAEYRGTALLGDPVPDLVLPTLDGGEVALAELDGKAVIINFWNSWCIPCKEEEPALKAFYAAHAGESDFEMIGIVRDDSESAIRKWVETHGTAWTVAFDPSARASVDFGTTGQPETFAVAPNGRIAALQRGRVSIDDLENMLALARGERPSGGGG